MNVNLYYKKNVIFNFEVPDNIMNTPKLNQQLIFIHNARDILDDFFERLDMDISLLKVTNIVLNNSIQVYEEEECYEECYIIQQITNLLSTTNRHLINELIENEAESH